MPHQKLRRDYIIFILLIGRVGRLFDIGPGDRGSIPGRVILKT